MFGIELLTERLFQLCWILNSVKKETEQYDSIPANWALGTMAGRINIKKSKLEKIADVFVDRATTGIHSKLRLCTRMSVTPISERILVSWLYVKSGNPQHKRDMATPMIFWVRHWRQ